MAIPHGRTRVWDLPTRSFHWLLVLAFTTAMVTAGADRYLDLHVFAGYVVLGLLAFRLLWGFIGTHYARFRSFSFGPASVRTFLHGVWHRRPPLHTGHNPAGAWAIFMMLSLLLAIGLSGVAVLGGEEQQGPLAATLSIAAGIGLHELHEVLAWAMVALVALHLLGVIVESRLQGENLAAAMLHGYKRGDGASVPVRPLRLLGWLLPLLVVGAAVVSFRGWWQQDSDHPYVPFQGPVLAQSALWQEECGACHLAYHPSLLPARSWQRLFDSQGEHFGEDLALAPQTLAQLHAFADANSADRGATEAAWRIAHSLTPRAAPLRISDAPYWQQKHRDIPDTVWQRKAVGSKANCGACHRDAAAGTFNDAAMRVPAAGPSQP